MKLPDPIEEFLHEPPVAPAIWPRRLFHLLAGSSLPVAILFLPEETAQWLLIAGSLLAVAAEVLRGLIPSVNDWMVRRLPFFKASERRQVTGATYLWLSATFLVFVFERDVAALALLFLAVGDPAAALIGARDHRARVFGKSLAGSFAFACVALGAGLLATLHPDVPLAWWIVPGAVIAALAELAPLPLDDNLTVPIASAAAMTLLALA